MLRNFVIISVIGIVNSAPASQPLYHSQYAHTANSQVPTAVQYNTVQSKSPQYIIQYDRSKGLQQYSNQASERSQKAQFGGPLYLEQIQAAQAQAEQENYPSQSIQRKTAVQSYRTPQPQQHYVQQNQPQYRYVYQKPTAEGFKPKGASHLKHQQKEEEEEEDYDPNPSYQFGFDVKDDLYTNYQNRKETKEGNKITGSYSVVDSDGFIRTVTYTADPKEGFKAEVSRTPTDIVVKIPKRDPPQFERHRPEQQFIQVAPKKGQHQHQHQHQHHRPAEKENVVYQYQ